ncbi:MAG: hypothetical protein HDS70_04440 [Bacteroidales bacterium]|nr:hypothetical protein [Bacteroidales bacterium]
MFRIKKEMKEKAQRFQMAMKDHLSPYVARLGEKLRLGSRLRLANAWAKRNPRKLMFNYSAFAVLLLGTTLTIDGLTAKDKEDKTLDLNTIPSMSHRIQSLRITEIQKERIRREVNELGQKGMAMYEELDSLIKLPVKTHSDSVRIINNYNILNKTFNNHGNEFKED